MGEGLWQTQTQSGRRPLILSLTRGACFFVPKAAQLTWKYFELGIVSAGGRGFTHEAGVPAGASSRLAPPWFPMQDSMCKPAAPMAPHPLNFQASSGKL